MKRWSWSVAACLVAGAVAFGSTPTTASTGVQRVVTLGDSYSSGTGIHRNASDYDDHGPSAQSFAPSSRIGNSDCLREFDETAGPRLAPNSARSRSSLRVPGATIADVPNQVDVADIPGDGAGTLVTITIGGNDLRTVRGENWPETLVRCITELGCDGSDENQVANFADLRAQLTDLYTSIGERYPDIAVRVLGYPRLLQSDRWCEGVAGISRGEADWVDEQVDVFNSVIATAAKTASARTGADIDFVSVVEQFDNHGACRFWQRDRFVNDAVLGDTLKRSMDAERRGARSLGLWAADHQRSFVPPELEGLRRLLRGPGGQRHRPGRPHPLTRP